MSSDITDKTNYYELLGVEETATPSEIKKAYYKAAMKWHPDRNPNNSEEATRVFQIIEHAYSILSDPHERSWYDSHKNVIQDEFGECQATSVDISSLFEAGAWSGFTDSPTGFFSVFRRAFGQLGKEEKVETPSFGDSETPYEKVEKFYSYWSCFTTKRNFGFTEKWHLKDAPDARIRRAMKQDNEKAKKKAEQEFVASVRELASFVRKRDPRVARHFREMEQAKEERQRLNELLKEEKRRQLEEELASYNEPVRELSEQDLAYVKQFEKPKKEFQWSCQYCNRDMDTESAFRQHCATKKHKKAVSGPRKDFITDPDMFEHSLFNYILYNLTEGEAERICGHPVDLGASLVGDDPASAPSVDEVQQEEEEIEERKPKKKSKKDLRKQQQKQKAQQREQEEQETAAPRFEERSGPKLSKKERKKQQEMENARRRLRALEEEDEEEPCAPVAEPVVEEEPVIQTPTLEEDEGLTKRAKAKQERREKKGPKRAPPGQFKMCRKCRAIFPSNRKLHAHLEDTGHAIAYY